MIATKPAVPPVMPTPTALSAGLSIECIAGYLNSDPNKTAKALGNLAAGGYVIRVSSNPDRWVRVVPVEVEMMGGVQPLSKKAAQRSPPEAPLAAVNPTMPTWPHFPVAEPAPTRQMIQLGPNLRVPLDSVTLVDDDGEVAAAPSKPSRPKMFVSPEVERRLAMCHGARSVSDVEREILMERYEAELGAGVVDDGELT